MTFTTLSFVLLLIVSFFLYWGIRKRSHQNFLVLLVSYFFYGWWDYRFCFLLFVSSLVDYLVGLTLANVENSRLRRLLLVTSLCSNLGLLGFFKYWNFFTDSLVSALTTLGWQVDFFTLQIILPVGISFYTFQTLSYTIDIYRRQLQPTYNFIDYLAYVSFFPQLVAGPIERATHLLPQFEKPRSFSSVQAVDGCQQILWGFAKKMLVADNLAPIVDVAYSNPADFPGPQLAFATFAFAFQIYCDFSAYSDIAIGTARLFGFDLMRNFAYPYFSQSMAEFWRRWHISLSTWLRDYVYIPLGGSRVDSAIRRAANVMITFLISGLWHGASWNFIVWGGIHGGVVLSEKLWTQRISLRVKDMPGGLGWLPHPGVAFRMLLTFTLVCVAWVFFRAQTLSDALYILTQIASDFFKVSAYQSLGEILIPSLIGRGVLVVLAVFILIEWLQRAYPHPLVMKHTYRPVRWIAYTSIFWITLFWGTWSPGQFVYFQF